MSNESAGLLDPIPGMNAIFTTQQHHLTGKSICSLVAYDLEYYRHHAVHLWAIMLLSVSMFLGCAGVSWGQEAH